MIDPITQYLQQPIGQSASLAEHVQQFLQLLSTPAASTGPGAARRAPQPGQPGQAQTRSAPQAGPGAAPRPAHAPQGNIPRPPPRPPAQTPVAAPGRPHAPAAAPGRSAAQARPASPPSPQRR
jgi:hypothetical protein